MSGHIPAHTLLMLLAATLMTTSAAKAQSTWYVDDDAPLGGDGITWATAFKYLQDGLWVTLTGDEVHVAQGAYKPDQDEAGNVTPGDREATFRLFPGVGLYGGYAGLSDPNDSDDRDVELYETVLSGDLNGDDGPGFANNGENSCHVVRDWWGEGEATLDGFTITAGNADTDAGGGGLCCSERSPMVANCVITGNMAAGSSWGGGGVWCSPWSSPVFSNCAILGNASAGDYDGGGGGVFVCGGGAAFVNCAIMGNMATTGGGVYTLHDWSTFTNCLIAGNEASWGGGFHSSDGDFALVNCTITANDGGGIDLWTEDAWPSLTNSIVCGNSPYEIEYFSMGGGFTISYSSTSGDPLFVKPDGLDGDPNTWEDNDYRLRSGSPCIDAANNDAVPPDTFDLDGDGDPNEPIPFDLDGSARFVDDPGTPGGGNGVPPIVDMGAYEHQLEPDQLHIVGPLPNQVPTGEAATINAMVEDVFVGVPDREVVFTKLLGSFTFTAGEVSPDGTEARVVTDEKGTGRMTFVADDVGLGFIGVTVTGTELPMAFSVFEIIEPAPGPEKTEVHQGPRRAIEEIDP